MTCFKPPWPGLLQRLLGRRRAAQRRFLMMNLADLDPMPLGPGWFDSSWELERGLQVDENVGIDACLQALLEASQREKARLRERAAMARAAVASARRVEPAVSQRSSPARKSVPAAAQRADNLIEFERVDVASLQLPATRCAAPRPGTIDLELTLVR
jgi:hypothetical protein